MIRARSVCPHDCPSACSLDVEIKDSHTIGRVYGALENTYTAGVICEKVARYAERAHHPARLLKPLKRKGPKGSGEFIEISWENALDDSEAVDPFFNAAFCDPDNKCAVLVGATLHH